MKVAIFGMGYVGAVTSACFSELGHHVIGVDTNRQKVDSINAGRSPIVETGVTEKIAAAVGAGRLRATTEAREALSEADVSIIAVGTPSNSRGMPELSIVDAVVEDIGRGIAESDGHHTVIVRSTVMPGTTSGHIAKALTRHSGRSPGDRWALCFNPEFLREGTAIEDFYSPPFTIAGSESKHGYDVLRDVYSGISAPFIETSCEVAESVKYICNAFHALKICFANEIGAILKSQGTDARDAMDLFCQDRVLNISPAYLRPGYAFGGSCLPKELRAIEFMAQTQNIQIPMLSQVLRSNDMHIDRAFDMVTRHGRGKVAFFGLAFKPGTDDLRESPLVLLAERLIGKGYELAIFDRHVEFGRLTGANREFIEHEIPHLERLLVSEPSQALADAETIVVGHAGSEEISEIVAKGGDRHIVDLQGIKELQDLSTADYEGICW